LDRKLASIQKILNIEPIDNADAILKTTILGWECVIKKDDGFQVGDLVCYVECDSIMPEKPEYEFLRERKFRVRTIKLRKQISQGLILPLSILPKGKYSEGDDVTKILGVTKYLNPSEQTEGRLEQERIAREKNKIKIFLMKNKWFRKLFRKEKIGFPKFISKTDEDRIQLFPNICEIEKDTLFTVTEKLDGQSGTWWLLKVKKLFGYKYVFGVCSRNLLRGKEDNSSYWKIANKYNMKTILEKLIGDNLWVAIQGEIIGEGIQGNKYRIKDIDMYAFNLLYPGWKVDHETMIQKLNSLGVKIVPTISYSINLEETIPEMVESSKGKSVIADILREGIVVRNYDKGLSFKIINPEFLLKYGE